MRQSQCCTYWSITITCIIMLTTNDTTNAQAVRVRVANVCGSGSIAGYDASGAYVLTNAHVAGTQIGRSVNVDYDTATGRVTLPATIVMAAYSDRTMTDWAILKVPSLKSGSKWTLSTTMPTERTHRTCGSPRCVWPLVCSQVTTTTIADNRSLWKFREISIGGQSGSSVRDSQEKTKGLITWRIGNEGGSQTTAGIYRQVTLQTTEAERRPEGLIEIATPRSTTENGFFTAANIETGIGELPIWDVQQDPPPAGNRTERETLLIDKLQKKGVAYADLVELLIQLVELFNNDQTP